VASPQENSSLVPQNIELMTPAYLEAHPLNSFTDYHTFANVVDVISYYNLKTLNSFMNNLVCDVGTLTQIYDCVKLMGISDES
jgi:hypothetical protein